MKAFALSREGSAVSLAAFLLWQGDVPHVQGCSPCPGVLPCCQGHF